MDTLSDYEDLPLTSRLRNFLAIRLRKPDTRLVTQQPDACPSCCCQRFERQPRGWLDRWLGRLGRYRCEKCFVVTLHVRSELLAAAETPTSALDPLSGGKGDGEYLFSLATRYVAGNQQQQNMGAAFTLFNQAAQLGHASAQYNLAVCYIQGISIGRDLQKGADWMCRAARQGHGKAIQALPHLLRRIKEERGAGSVACHST